MWKFTSYERDGGVRQRLRSDALPHQSPWPLQLSPDPILGSIADPQSLNRYAYVLNDPMNLIDPLGLVAEHQIIRTGLL